MRKVKRARPRRWRASVKLLHGEIANVMQSNGEDFHGGLYASDEGPIQVEIREIPKRTRSR